MGPLFFILFINDLPLHVSSQIDLYADDTTITTSSDFRNISLLELSLNTSVSEIQLWANANKLPLNEEKTKVLCLAHGIGCQGHGIGCPKYVTLNKALDFKITTLL